MLLRGCLLVAASLLLSSASTLWAQDDPFGTGGGANGDDGGLFGGDGLFGGGLDPAAAPTPAPQAGQPVPEATTDPLVLQLRRYAAGTPEQLGVAVREATRLRLWSELNHFLAKARIEGLSPPERVRVAATVGGDLLARAGTEATISDEARASLGLLREAAAAAAIDPASLDAAIAQLGSASYDDRLSATRTLLRGGNAALAKLAAAAAAAEPPAPRQRIIDVLRGFGQSAFDAVTPLALYGSESVRGGALQTLAALDRDQAVPMLVSALHSRSASPSEREVATAVLGRLFPTLPSRHETETYLVDQLRVANDAYRRSEYGLAGAEIWQIDETRTAVERVVPISPVAAAARAVSIASMLQRLGELHPSTRSAAVQAELRYRLLIDPIFGSESDLAAIEASWGEAIAEPIFLSRMLSEALGDPVGDTLAHTFAESLGNAFGDPGRGGAGGPIAVNDDPAAAIGLIRLMAAAGNPEVVYTTGAHPSPLVSAVSHADPRVRYEAASAIGILAPDRPYEQSNRALDRWIEMSQLDDAPLALLMMNDASSSRVLNAHLDQLGYRVVRVPTAASLVDAVDEGGDLQLIIATTTPPDMVAVEMVDRVRRQPFGGTVPILLIGESTESLVSIGDRWSAPLRQMRLPQTVAALAATIRPMVDAAPLPPLSAAERQSFAISGLTMLSKLSTAEGLQRPYDLLSREGALVEASQRSGFSAPSLGVLSALGTLESQALLATLAANSSLEVELRKRAAEAFADSVDRFGTRLSRSQVAEQYERFNAAKNDEGRGAISRVLDAMEAHVGVSTNPQEKAPQEKASAP